MLMRTWQRMGVAGCVAVAGTMLGSTAAQAEPYGHYTRVYQTQPAYIDYGTPYVPAYARPGCGSPSVVYTRPAVPYVEPVYYSRPYVVERPVYYAPPVRAYYAPVYYPRAHYYGGYGRHHGQHRSWGFGVGGGHGGGGFSFHYNRHR